MVTRLLTAVQFIVSEGLDGVDFDWEYPGAPDMEGIPPASSSDGLNYLLFLAKVRQLLPKNLEIAIAAPASYWYLKGFPINMIAAFTDYMCALPPSPLLPPQTK